MQPVPDVGVIVLNYNSWQETVRCLESLRALHYPRWQAIVVDNGSTNDSVAQLHAWAAAAGWTVTSAATTEEGGRRPLALLTISENREFTGGSNVGLRHALRAGFDYIALLNNDIVVDPRFLDALVACAENEPQAGMLGPLVYEREQPDIIQSAGALIHWWTAKFPPVGSGRRDNGQHCVPCRRGYVSVAMLVRRTALERVGGLDEAFGLYVEEVDWCQRFAVAGYGVWLVPQSKIWHRGAVTTGAMPGLRVQYCRFRNRIFFMRKHARWYHWLVFGLYLARHMAGKTIGCVAAGRWQQYRVLWRALHDGFCLKLTPKSTQL